MATRQLGHAEQTDDSAEIDALRRAGLWVLVRDIEICCPDTDAHMGWARTCLGASPTPEGAEAEHRRRQGPIGYQDHDGPYVVGPIAGPGGPTVADRPAVDDLPF